MFDLKRQGKVITFRLCRLGSSEDILLYLRWLQSLNFNELLNVKARKKRSCKLLGPELWGGQEAYRLGTNFGFPLTSWWLELPSLQKAYQLWAGDLLILIAFRLHNDRKHRTTTSSKHKSCAAGQRRIYEAFRLAGARLVPEAAANEINGIDGALGPFTSRIDESVGRHSE